MQVQKDLREQTMIRAGELPQSSLPLLQRETRAVMENLVTISPPVSTHPEGIPLPCRLTRLQTQYKVLQQALWTTARHPLCPWLQQHHKRSFLPQSRIHLDRKQSQRLLLYLSNHRVGPRLKGVLHRHKVQKLFSNQRVG